MTVPHFLHPPLSLCRSRNGKPLIFYRFMSLQRPWSRPPTRITFWRRCWPPNSNPPSRNVPFPYTRIKIPHCGKIHEHTGVQIYTRAHSHTYTYSLHLGSFAVGGARDKFSGTEILFCYVGLGVLRRTDDAKSFCSE